MLLDVFETVIDALTRWSNGIGLGIIVVIALGLVLLTIIISFLATQNSIERKTTKAVSKINSYLEKHPFITDENLVEFNKLMKHVPSQMRSQWQQFMVNRDRKPSEFFTDNNCIEKPFKASAYNNHIVATRTFSIIIAILSFVFCLAFYTKSSTDTIFSYQSLLSSLIVPAVVIIIAEIYIFFLKARRNSLISELYSSFNNFRKSLDRAVTTLPEYVDYEILFTRKEITAGIPVLQEYLEQRARYEQEQIKKAKESEVVHENYDFSALGVNGSLVMERAMRECEYFIGNKKRILAEISEIESSRDMLDKNYDEKNKTTQRKLRDIKESLERLKEKLDATTNLIVGNDLRKQRENEIQKQRQLEKESDEDNKKYEEDKKKLTEQVEAKRAEIEGFRKNIEVALNGEFMTYADKIYAEIQQKLATEQKEHMDSLSAEIVTLQQALEDKDRIIIEKSTIVGERDGAVADKDGRIAELEQFIEENQYNEKTNAINTKNKEIFAVKKELESRNLEIEKKEKQIERQKEYIDELKSKKGIEGDQLYTDENGALYFVDAYGNRKYIAKTVNSAEELNSAFIEQPVDVEQQSELQQIAEQQPDENLIAEPEQELGEGNQQTNSSLGFSDADIFVDDELTNQEVEHEGLESERDREEVPTELNNEESKEEFNGEQVSDVDKWITTEDTEEPKEISVDDNMLDDLVDDEKINNETADNSDSIAENVEDNNVATDVLVEPEEKVEDIDELDKMIEEKNAELEKQQESLSKQLEQTQNLADLDNVQTAGEEAVEMPEKDEDVEALSKQDEDVEKQAETQPEDVEVKEDKSEHNDKPKVLHKKKKPVHNSSKNPEAKKISKAKSAKPLTKKASDSKSNKTAKASKSGSKTSAKKPVAKTLAKKSATKNAVAKKKKPDVGGNTPIVNLNLSQFNNQLKKMMKDIDKGNK